MGRIRETNNSVFEVSISSNPDGFRKEKVEMEKTEERALCSGRRQHQLKVNFSFTEEQGALPSCLYCISCRNCCWGSKLNFLKGPTSC